MKKFILALGICLCAMAVCSCDQQSPQEGGLDKGGTLDGEGGRSPYLFSGILKISDMKIMPNDGNGYELGTTDCTSLLLLLSGDMCSQFSAATSKEFKQLAEEIGDLPKEEGYSHATPVDNLTTESSISAIEIKALSTYDEVHPEGSSLKDIVRIKYQSFDHVFDRSLKPANFGSQYHAMYSIEPDEDFTPIKYPALIAGHFSEEDGGMFMDGLTMSIEFTEAPVTPRQQLQVTISFEDGKELKRDVTVDILEIE